MPELPEVEHVKRQLEQLLRLPARVSKVHFFRADLRFPIPKDLARKFQNSEVLSIERRAKYLLFRTSQGAFLSHLGMSGSWRPAEPNEPLRLHDHVEVLFASGLRLLFNDPRRFGLVDWVEPHGKHDRLDHLGPEPLAIDFSGETLFKSLRRRKAAIKVSIMDQRIVVGVGNIYASEALFRAGLRPTRAAGRLTRQDCDRLVHEIKEILKQAIDSGGSTIRTYRGTDGGPGQFQSLLAVYERDGDRCVRCQKGVIRTKTIGGRSTYWCPKCQS